MQRTEFFKLSRHQQITDEVSKFFNFHHQREQISSATHTPHFGQGKVFISPLSKMIGSLSSSRQGERLISRSRIFIEFLAKRPSSSGWQKSGCSRRLTSSAAFAAVKASPTPLM